MLMIIIIFFFKTCERRYSSRQDFTLMMKAVLMTMSIEYWKYFRYFAPHKLVFNHIPREEVIQDNTRQLARNLMTEDVTSNQAILVLDGTNVYIQKSSNIAYARISYTKGIVTNLVKNCLSDFILYNASVRHL